MRKYVQMPARTLAGNFCNYINLQVTLRTGIWYVRQLRTQVTTYVAYARVFTYVHIHSNTGVVCSLLFVTDVTERLNGMAHHNETGEGEAIIPVWRLQLAHGANTDPHAHLVCL